MGEPQATGVASNGASSAVTRDQLLAELQSGAAGSDEPEKAAPPAEKPAPKAEPEPDADETDAPEPADEPDADDEPEPDEDDDEDDPDALSAKDPETAKRLATVRKQEQRARESIAAERREFERERAEHARDIAAVREFNTMRDRFRYDPMSVIRALGAVEDDYETIGRAVYAHSKKGAADPRNKEAVERSLKERELQDELASVRKRLDERDTTEKQQRELASAQREAAKYVESVAKAASDKTPLAAHFLAKSPEKTKARLGAIALEIYDETDRQPTAREVLKRYEKVRREELVELGLDPATYTKAKPAAPAAQDAKAGTTPAKKNEPAGTPTRDELLAELRQLD